MPYIDIQHQNYEDVLTTYTISLVNGRYDTYNSQASYDNETVQHEDALLHSLNAYITDNNIIKKNDDTSYYYNYYNTYRRNIISEDYNTKLYETAFGDNVKNKKVLNDIYYNLTDSSYFKFPGIALNYYYPCNGQIASLEDIFAEYGYDYIVAKDQENFELTGEYYYFDKNITDVNLQFAYTIIPIYDSKGNINRYEDPETGEYSNIEYDGTTVPNVTQILSGNLYIIFKSNNQRPRKIYFNNEYIPTLFVNDDKYNEKSIDKNVLDHTYKYILNDMQPMRLCDISRIKPRGYTILWENSFITFAKNYKLLGSINQYQIDDTGIIIKYSNNLPILDIGICIHVYVLLDNKANGITYSMMYDVTSNPPHYHPCYISLLDKSNPFETYKDTTYYIPNETDTKVTGSYVYPPFINKSFGPVPRKLDESYNADFTFIIVPSIYITSNNNGGEYILRKDSTCNIQKTNNINNTVYINLENTKTSINYNESNEILLDSTWYNQKNNTSLKLYTTISEYSDSQSNLTLSSNTDNNDYYGKNGIQITNITYKDNYTYKLSNNIITVDLSNCNVTINLSDTIKSPGFFKPIKPNYSPVFLEWVDDDELIPVFLIKNE